MFHNETSTNWLLNIMCQNGVEQMLMSTLMKYDTLQLGLIVF